MRSLILALAFAAPLSAVAATPNYTSPMSTVHESKVSEVYVTFQNASSQDRELIIDGQSFKLQPASLTHMYINVGSKVRVYSNTNSKVDGSLMQISASDESRTVVLK